MMFPFEVTPDIVRWTGVLDRAAKSLDERILPRRWEGRLRRALEAEVVAASTSMEGVPVTVDDALKILAGDPPDSVSPADQALVRGYRDAMTYVQRRADDGQLQWNRELVVGVQDRVLAGSYAAGAGRLRDGAAWIRNVSTGEVVFAPPEHEVVPRLVDEACAAIEAAGWHPAIAAGWLHVAVAAIHPFKDGNGRTARVLASLAMYRGGFKHPAFTSLEEWWGKKPRAYYAAFHCLGASFDRSVDVTPFIKAHVYAQSTQVLALAMRQQAEGLLWTTLENLLEDRGLPARLANALYDSFFGRAVTTGYYRDLIDASAATARNDLQAASAAGLLTPVGRTRGRRYEPAPRLMRVTARALGVSEEDSHSLMAHLVARVSGTVADDLLSADLIQPRLPGLEDKLR